MVLFGSRKDGPHTWYCWIETSLLQLAFPQPTKKQMRKRISPFGLSTLTNRQADSESNLLPHHFFSFLFSLFWVPFTLAKERRNCCMYHGSTKFVQPIFTGCSIELIKTRKKAMCLSKLSSHSRNPWAMVTIICSPHLIITLD